MNRFARNLARNAATAVLLGVGLVAPARQPAHAAPRGDGQLVVEVVDADTGKPIAARMQLKNSRGRPVTLRLPNTAEFGGQFYVDGRLALPFRLGQYTFDIDAGPEYRTQSGHFEIERHADDTKRIEMKRFANLAEEGWYGGDLDVARRAADLPLILRGEGLSVVPLQPMTSRGRTTRPRSGDDSEAAEKAAPKNVGPGPFARMLQSTGGELLLVGAAANDSPPSVLAMIRHAHQAGARVIARTPYAWDLPVWLASGELDAIQLIHHHALWDGVVDNENDGRPRDKKLFPGTSGNGRWSEAVYYHALNCGLRIPPVAGSGSGENDNPVGANRVYAYCGDEFSQENWWDAVEAGRVVVTNGPLLRPKVEGHTPGYVFHLDGGGSLSLEAGLDLATRVPIDYLQIVKNGEPENEVRLAEWTNRKGRLPPLVFNDSGWFLVRAVTNSARSYQLAASGPYYVEKAGKPRVSRRSVQFFLDWIEEAKKRIAGLPKLEEAERQALLAEQESARAFFERLLAEANAD